MSKRTLLFITSFIFLAFLLRIYRLDSIPLRGDEAFTVRYWAASPAEVLTQLAGKEPHPLGAFFSFWAWKQLVGDSELAMRLLPALCGLLGVPAMYGLGKRLTRDSRIGLLGAFFWAINPNLLWHGQDVRNYAIWSAFSVVTLWLLCCALDRAPTLTHGARWLSWLLYILAATFSLYFFFLEIFMLAIHGLIAFGRGRNVFRHWLLSLGVILIFLIPWFGQAWALAHSGYGGTGEYANISTLLTRFLPELIFGEPFYAVLPDAFRLLLLAWFLLCVMTTLRFSQLGKSSQSRAAWLVVMVFLPTSLLFLASTRFGVFYPRYLLAIVPALILIPVYTGIQVARQLQRRGVAVLILAPLMLGILPALGVYYFGAVQKSPDWYGLRDYLRANTTPNDAVIMSASDTSGVADPAFEYYYRGPASVVTLPNPTIDTNQVVQDLLSSHRAVWFVVVGNPAAVNSALDHNSQLISDTAAGHSYIVRQYRGTATRPDEISHKLDLFVGGGHLIGYSLAHEQASKNLLTILLFWQTLPISGQTTFIHLIGSPKADGSPLYSQEDHPSTAIRDIYHLDLSTVPPGEYRLEIGLYNPSDPGHPLLISDNTGKSLGTSYLLTKIQP